MSTFAIVIAAGGWILGWFVGLARRMPPEGRETSARVTVIIPARNEARRIPNLLRRVCATDVDVIVVDDASDDDTAAIAERAGAKVLSVAPPPGWTGKSWACWRGALAASGDVFVFLDADTEPGPDAVQRLARRAAGANELVSVQPFHRTERLYEQLSGVVNLVAVMGAGTGPPARHRWWRRPTAYGMALAIPRRVYFDAGGHEAVRGDVAEDLALARAVDRHGGRVSAWCGGADIAVRMYGEGPTQLWEGWRKNIAAGAGSVPQLRLLCVVAWVTAVTQTCGVLLAACLGFGTTSLALALAVFTAFVAQTAILARRIGRFTLGSVFALPVLVAAFLALFASSLLALTLRRDVPWRGRPVRVRTPT